MKREMVWALLVSASLTACGGTDESGDSSAGGAGSSSEAASSSSGNGVGGGAVGSGGGAVGGGASVGSGGAGGDDPSSASCEEFPATMPLAAVPNDPPGFKHAILCFQDDGTLDQECLLTNVLTNFNCPNPASHHLHFFKDPGGSYSVSLKPNTGSWVSTTGGAISLNGVIGGLPTNMPVTAVFGQPAGQYTVVFTIDAADNLTITSFEPS